MKEYTLYLDESETHNYDKCNKIDINHQFVIAGIIVEKSYHDTFLTNNINRLKQNIWNKCNIDCSNECSSYILHELEMTRAITGNSKKLKCNYNRIFKNKHVYNYTYDIMSEFIATSEIVIIGVCIDKENIERIYTEQIINDRLSIGMNLLIENYYHFLYNNDGVGYICYESMPENQNDVIRKRYNQIKSSGTMFYSAKTINQRIKSLEFADKYSNIAGLQISDFIPNSLGRNVLNKTYNNRQRNVPYEIIKGKLYDGGINNINRFGFKIIP